MWQDIHQAVQDADYRRGLELFAVLDDPSPQAFRWAGACHLHLSNLLEARRLLLTAVARGEEAARVQLASCLRCEGEFAGAREHLEQLNVDQLEPDDATSALRGLAVLEEECGAIARATALLDQAWGHAVAARPMVQVTVAQSIGLIASRQGNDRKAERYLEFAARHANAMQRVYILAAQARCTGYLGQYDQARVCLEAADQELGRFPLAAPLLAYHWGVCWAGLGELEHAREAFERCASLAREALQPSTEFFAQLGAAAVATVSADEAAERRHLMRARALVDSPREQAYLDLRSGAARVRQEDPESLNSWKLH